jgi:hypothetical protein
VPLKEAAMSHGPSPRDSSIRRDPVESTPNARRRRWHHSLAISAISVIVVLTATGAHVPDDETGGATTTSTTGDDDQRGRTTTTEHGETGSATTSDTDRTTSTRDDERSTTTTERATTTTTERVTTTTTEPPTTTTDLSAITAERQAAAEEACTTAVMAPLDLPLTPEEAAELTWKKRFGRVDSKDAFVNQIAECTGPQRAARVEQECTDSPDVQLLLRDPDRLLGECFTLTVLVTQFDATTGACAFRGAFDTVAHEYSFEYVGDNAIFSALEPCPFLDDVYNDTVVDMRVVGYGATSYETTLGAELTVPTFSVFALG